MNDRFNFRVWNKEEKRFINFDDVKKQEIEFNFDPVDNYFSIECDPGKYKILQCTGLPDKNDKLIYEGDIIRFIEAHPGTAVDTCICGVFFIERYSYYSTIPLNRLPKNSDKSITQEDVEYISGRFGVSMCKGFHFLSGEIIGNIYENPELLEVNNEHT